MKRFVSVVLRLFGFVQWLAAVMIAVLCVWFHVDTMAQAGDAEVDAALGESGALLVALLPVIKETQVSFAVSIPGLLLSILLILSANYCSLGARSGSRHRAVARSAEPSPPDSERPDTRGRDPIPTDQD